MTEDNQLAELLQELAEGRVELDQRGLVFATGSDISSLSRDELLNQLCFLRWRAGLITILSIMEPRLSPRQFKNEILDSRLEALEEEIQIRQRSIGSA